MPDQTPANEFVSEVGVFPMSVVTQAMKVALGTADDAGAVIGSSQTLNRLIRYGLAEDRRIRGVFLTDAGRNVLDTLPRPNPHTTRTWDTGPSRLNWRKARMEPSRTAAWSCACGQSGFAASREEARSIARRHREAGQKGMTRG